MVNNNYFQTFKNAIARIHHANGAVVGAGFLVSDRHLLTCAHVVAAAFSIPINTQECPTGSIELDFPLMAPGQKVKAKVVFWLPVNPSQSGEDIAGLEIEGSPPASINPIPLQTTEDYWEHKFRIFGFPQGHDVGIWATGTLRDKRGNGWIQLDAIVAQNRAVEPGFSGAPVWDESLQGVVGMVVAAEKRREDVTAAFMIPTSILRAAWPELELLVRPSGNLQSSNAINLNNQQQKQLREALISAFPDQGDLEIMLNEDLGIPLNTIAGGRTYIQIVYNVVNWFNSHGRLSELIWSAHKSNPKNKELNTFIENHGLGE